MMEMDIKSVVVSIDLSRTGFNRFEIDLASQKSNDPTAFPSKSLPHQKIALYGMMAPLAINAAIF